MAPPDSEVSYGTLDLIVLKTLASVGPLHGFGIARRIEQVADGAFALNQGTTYPSPLRLEQKGLDYERMRYERQQSSCPLLLDYTGRQEAAFCGNRELGPQVAVVKRLLESEP